ncbi:MAG: hypothetical protein K2H24_03245, partial [Clostridia bacterium]|nr:hypothetical protein [Clostridia bacterium]
STVIGSNNNVYNCQLNFDKNRLKSHLCNCPAHYNYYGPCKHIVATMLSIRELRLSKEKLSNAKASCSKSAQIEKKVEQNNCGNKSNNTSNNFSQNRITNEVFQKKLDIKESPQTFWWNDDKFTPKEIKIDILQKSKEYQATKISSSILKDSELAKQPIELKSLEHSLGKSIVNEFSKTLSPESTHNCKEDSTMVSNGDVRVLPEEAALFLIRKFKREKVARCVGYIEFSKIDSNLLKQEYLKSVGFEDDIINATKFLLKYGANFEEANKYKGAVARSVNLFMEKRKSATSISAANMNDDKPNENCDHGSGNDNKYNQYNGSRSVFHFGILIAIFAILNVVSCVGLCVTYASNEYENIAMAISGLVIMGLLLICCLVEIGVSDVRSLYVLVSVGFYLTINLGIIITCVSGQMVIFWTVVYIISLISIFVISTEIYKNNKVAFLCIPLILNFFVIMLICLMAR